MCFLLVLFSRFLIGHTKKVILSKQDDILIQVKVGKDNSYVCIALKYITISEEVKLILCLVFVLFKVLIIYGFEFLG